MAAAAAAAALGGKWPPRLSDARARASLCSAFGAGGGGDDAAAGLTVDTSSPLPLTSPHPHHPSFLAFCIPTGGLTIRHLRFCVPSSSSLDGPAIPLDLLSSVSGLSGSFFMLAQPPLSSVISASTRASSSSGHCVWAGARRKTGRHLFLVTQNAQRACWARKARPNRAHQARAGSYSSSSTPPSSTTAAPPPRAPPPCPPPESAPARPESPSAPRAGPPRPRAPP